jgi:lipoprotein-anchoring transpeptidase ErfK/SrfK
MGRLVHLPPQAAFALGVLAAVGLAYSTFFLRPASGRSVDPPAEAPATPSTPDPAPRDPEVVRVAASPAPAPAARRKPSGYQIVAPKPGRTLVVRARRGGAVVARLGARTEFGSPTTLAVAARRGRWFGVVTTHLPNGRLGWVDPAESALRKTRIRKSLVLDLSARRLVLRDGKRILRRMIVGIGRPESPTPRGRFAVTDKLSGPAYSASYGCCILALSAHQPNLPAGWRGGDRIAVHGTNDPSSIGVPSSAGCPHARDVDLRYLFRRVPLGTPIFIRA